MTISEIFKSGLGMPKGGLFGRFRLRPYDHECRPGNLAHRGRAYGTGLRRGHNDGHQREPSALPRPGHPSSNDLNPVLQPQDGSFVGTVQVWYDADMNPQTDMVAFDQTGSVRWMVPGNYQPQIATADGGVIATDPSGVAITFDQYGSATGVLAGSPTQSWTGSTYQLGSIKDVASAPTAVATPPYSSSRGLINRVTALPRYATTSATNSLPNMAKPSFWTVRTPRSHGQVLSLKLHGRVSPRTVLSLQMRRIPLHSPLLKSTIPAQRRENLSSAGL